MKTARIYVAWRFLSFSKNPCYMANLIITLTLSEVKENSYPYISINIKEWTKKKKEAVKAGRKRNYQMNCGEEYEYKKRAIKRQQQPYR